MASHRIVLIAGFESFNAGLYRQAAEAAMGRCPALEIRNFSDRDLAGRPAEVEAALRGAQVLFASLIFDYDQVEWLRPRIAAIPTRLVFESALELMALTRLGRFEMGGSSSGMPKPVRALLAKFSSGREEDRLAGYIGFLKVGPKLLRFIPLRRAQDLRRWLIIYGYWNAGGSENVSALFLLLARECLGLDVGPVPPPCETPDLGLLHPDHDGFFTSPRAYLYWFHQSRPGSAGWPVVGVLLYRKHVITAQPYIPQLIRSFEQARLLPLPVFINGVEGHMAVRDWMTSPAEIAAGTSGREAVVVDAIVSTIGFPLVGGPAGSMEAGRREEVAQRILRAKNVPYVVSAPLLIQDIHSWTRQGIGGLQSVVLYALPELDGAIDPVPLGGLVGDRIHLIPERLKRLTGRLTHWIALRSKPPAQRRIAIVLYGFPPGYGATGTAALLQVPQSLLRLLRALEAEGYDVGELPDDPEVLLQRVREADQAWIGRVPEGVSLDEAPIATVRTDTLRDWLGDFDTRRIEAQWRSLGGSGIRTIGDRFLLGGVRLGNVWIGVQPPLGVAGDPMRLMYERDLTPHPEYAAFYKWLQNEFRADAVVHFGMHGTVEWLPGCPLGNTGYSWPDILMGDLPNLYIYAANNPSESMLARRRGYGVLISHNVPPYGRAGLYRELVLLRDLISEYREDPERNAALCEAITKKVFDTGLDADCPPGEVLTAGPAAAESFTAYLVRLSEYLQLLENRLFSSGLHVLGQAPDPEELEGYLKAYFGDDLEPELVSAISLEKAASGEAERSAQAAALIDRLAPGRLDVLRPRVEEALLISHLLARSTEELTNLLRGLNGEYIPPAPGGDLLRDGPGVLPTGRNIHALDPYRMPSPAAVARGKAIALRILEQHRQENGTWPETVAVMLWGLDAIKTRGESLGILLELVGAEPVKEGTGRIVRYALRPLQELGHPRVDVLVNLSGIFRDSFVNIVELLDDLFRRAAAAEESESDNFIRRHARALEAQGIENPTARLFSNPAGDFGSLVNERVTDSNWDSGEELGSTWRERNSYSYGRGDRGEARPEVLRTLLGSTERVVQQIDSVEFGLTDIQEYYANTGALKQAAEQQRGAKVTASFVESFSKDITPRDLEELLRMEYRTKLVNPKWAEAMAAMGAGGAYEISQRMTALIGWAGTADFCDAWVYDQAADTYAFDPEMARRLREANPEAFRNLVGRMLEANARGIWTATPEKLVQLRNLYDLTDAELEGVAA
ncbi:magnesium chelatase subunit H [Synechococcus sp. Cruz-9H2]|nr:magnesium chelatase subunit H [Synechococcus sp. Cruz-9H2]MCP9842243.1 magnesium chelatase subunit H [Synechococcus sp. Edmonson 11F2]MCP9854653.1 magnesium chelatase subunit H [Synechococcus sp. Cruz-9C9]MCP9861651.1 magnesium chelatase subunit H [Synechococcus sp. Cruz-7E5]MCP9869165.1 magnesium chelatase subunit H [Synechococcus sp. Cruz-7B9]